MAKSKMYVGIDPDREKNGVALYSSRTETLLELLNLSFFDLFDYLKRLKDEYQEELVVVIEAGWMNRSNWHTRCTDSAVKAAKIGKWVGGNHEVGQKLVEMAEYLGITYRLTIPRRHKFDAKSFKDFTGWTKRTNPEQRDAALLVYGL